MTSTVFIEDIFIQLCDTLDFAPVSFQKQDRSAIVSFYSTLITNQRLTQNQGNYILRLLGKYRNLSKMHGFDYEEHLADPKWRNPFRTLDMSRKVWLEQDSEGCPWICLKFPYLLKKEFEEAILIADSFEGRDFGNVWDKERRVRMLSLYEFNIVQVYDFIKDNHFEIDESFYDALASVEEIWQKQDDVIKTCTISNSKVQLNNANEDALTYFKNNSINNITNDLLLAKSMGYYFAQQPSNKAQKIAGTKTTQFYVSNYKDLFEIASQIQGNIVFVIDRTVDALEWLKTLKTNIDLNNINREEFKVCFRESNKDNPEFNNWVKENGFGGKVDTGKYLIFKHKPAKWLFSNNIDVKIIVTNNVYPSTNPLTKQWIATHPCVIYFDEVKPSYGSNTIVEL